jgi:aldehyde:ferredoxin oxidoreductase
VIKCSNVYHDKEGKYLTSGFEYETIWAFGAHTTIRNLDEIAMMDRLCDDFGLDTIEMGVTIGIAMEGGLIPWGDGKASIELLSKVGEYSPEGKIIGNGALFTGDALGVDRVPVVKKQAFPAYDPRSCKGVGVTYATSPMGADHTAGYGVTANILSVGGTIDPLKKEGNVELSQGLQVATAAIDAAGLCLFIAFAVLDNEDGLPTVAKMLNAQYGLELTPDDILELGKSILRNEKEFNKKAGFTAVDDLMPEFFQEEFPPHKTQWDFTQEDLQKTLDF